MIDGSKKRNRQLAFELHNSHVCEKRSNTGFLLMHTCAYLMCKNRKGFSLLQTEESQECTGTGYYHYIFAAFGLMYRNTLWNINFQNKWEVY